MFISKYKFKTMIGGYFSLFSLCSLPSPLPLFFWGGGFVCFSCIFYFLKPFCFVLRNSWLTALWSFSPLFDRKHLCPRFQLCGSGRADDTYNRHLLLLLVHHSAPPLLFLFYKPFSSPVNPSDFVAGADISLHLCVWVVHDPVLTNQIISSSQPPWLA